MSSVNIGRIDKASRMAVFGGGGFIGSHLIKGLTAKRYTSVLCLDLVEDKLQRLVPGAGFEFRRCDIRQEDQVVRAVIEESDLVIDLVAYANPIVYIESPLEVVELNLFDNLKIVDHCARLGTPLIQFSTCEVYGKTGGSEDSFNEDTTDLILGPVGNHRWIYSCAKQLLERIIHARGLRGEIDYVIIRPFNFIGPEMDYLVESPSEGIPRVFPSFLSALIHGQPMYLVDGGGSKRTLTYIDDAVEAILLIIENLDRLRNEIVNIGSPQNEVSMRELACLMRELYEEIAGEASTARIMDVPAEVFYGEGYEDCDRRIPDISKLARLGWRPRHDLDRTLRKSIQYYCATRLASR